MCHKRDTLIFYTSATCNLRCLYCYIDKNPALKKIDKMLEKSFQDENYYFNFSKEFFNNPSDLKHVQFWGGEPSTGLHRVYKLIPKLIQYYPNLEEFFMSTNFTTSDWFNEFYGFLSILGTFPERNFIFSLQLSIDGPDYINDINRGLGTTKKFLEHYYELCQTLKANKPKNVIVRIHFKQTFSNREFKILSTKEQIIDYFQFFDDLLKYKDSYIKKEDCIFFCPHTPNIATPGIHTKQDGINFANYCKLTREIEKEKLFTYYRKLNSFSKNSRTEISNDSYITNCTYCESGIKTIGLLPNNYVSLCHLGFTQLLEDYKINSKNNHINSSENIIMQDLFINENVVQSLCIPKEELEERLKEYELFNHKNYFQMINMVSLIKILALAKQIDPKFLQEEKAIEAAHFLLSMTPNCIRDNATINGTLTMRPMGDIKLFLNGAYEYLIQEN